MESSEAAARVLTSRQKSCNTCVQRKKRCDRRMPVCSYCDQRTLRCIYSKHKVTSQPNNRGIEAILYSDALSFGRASPSLLEPGLPLDVGYLGSLSTTSGPDITTGSTPQLGIDAFGSEDIAMGSLMELINNNNSPSMDQWLISTDESLFTERPGTPVDGEIGRAYQKMANFCVSPIYSPLPIVDSAITSAHLAS